MLNISLHDPKDAKTQLLTTSYGPFSCVTISCTGGGTADVYSLSPEDLAKIGKALIDASVNLQKAIDNANGDRVPDTELPGMWSYSDTEGGETDNDIGG